MSAVVGLVEESGNQRHRRDRQEPDGSRSRHQGSHGGRRSRDRSSRRGVMSPAQCAGPNGQHPARAGCQQGKGHATSALAGFLAKWARRMSWKQAAEVFLRQILAQWPGALRNSECGREEPCGCSPATDLRCRQTSTGPARTAYPVCRTVLARLPPCAASPWKCGGRLAPILSGLHPTPAETTVARPIHVCRNNPYCTKERFASNPEILWKKLYFCQEGSSGQWSRTSRRL